MNSSYESVFFPDSLLPKGARVADLPNRNVIFEFELAKSENRASGVQAIYVQLISPKR